jgi:hypothetical protein
LFTIISKLNITLDEYTLIHDTPKIYSPYMANEINEYIKGTVFNTYSSNYLLENMNVNIKIYSDTTIEIKKYLFFIKLVLTMCVKNANHKNKEINIKIILSPINKTCPTIPILPSHINSGQTDPNKNEIIIFRKEEWLKVFIHECFHLFCLDFCNVTFNYIRQFKELYNVNGEYLFFESLTELWARTVNLSIISYYTKDNCLYVYLRKHDGRYNLDFIDNIGVYIYSKKVLDYIKDDENIDVNVLTHRLLQQGEKVFAFREDGPYFWIDIGTHADYSKANEEFSKIQSLFPFLER